MAAVGTAFPLSIDAANITAGTIGSARLPEASASAAGIVTTGSQTLAGTKNFSGGMSVGLGGGRLLQQQVVSGHTKTGLNTYYVDTIFDIPSSGAWVLAIEAFWYNTGNRQCFLGYAYGLGGSISINEFLVISLPGGTLSIINQGTKFRVQAVGYDSGAVASSRTVFRLYEA